MKQYTMTSGQQDKVGTPIMVYSDYGYGKTDALGTLPEPIAIINTEPRDPRIVLSRAHSDKKIKIFEPEGFDETIDLLSQMERAAGEGKLPFKGIGFDSLSFSQSTFKLTLEDDRYEVRVAKNDARDGLVDRFRLDQADWGPIGSIMKRITASFNRLSKYGIIVVANATLISNPTWKKSLQAAPAFAGKEYPSVMTGYYDFIWFVIEPYQLLPNGKSKPPIVAFRSPLEGYGDFVAKCCNEKLLRAGTGPLDYGRLIRVIRGENGRKEVVTEGSKVESSSSREKEKEILENSPWG